MKDTRKIMKVRKGFLLLIIVSTSCLSGCIGMGSKFDCNVSSGGRCAPMHHINRMADKGAFREHSNYGKTTSLTKSNYGYSSKNFEGALIRSNESIGQIWIGPYEDMNGNYHEPAYVYSVIRKGKWIGEPVSVTQDFASSTAAV